MYQQMKEIYQTILELTSRKIRWDIQIIVIISGGENNQLCRTYSVCEPQVNRLLPVCAQYADYCKIVHTGVHPLIFLVVCIPEDSLTYQPLPCNSAHT